MSLLLCSPDNLTVEAVGIAPFVDDPAGTLLNVPFPISDDPEGSLDVRSPIPNE